MNIIRANGVPIWVTILIAVVGIAGTALGVSALLDPSAAMGYIDGADALGLSWGGRNTGLGVALIVAVLLRNANGYAVALSGSIFRELSDVIGAWPDQLGTAIGLGVFLLVEVVCFIICVRAALANRSAMSSS